MTWRRYSDWAKERPMSLVLADFLGRGRGRMRMFDSLYPARQPKLKPDLANWEEHSLAAVWIGHATILLRVNGMNILTDPVMSSRVGIGLGLMTGGPRRLYAPALTVRQLPKIDLILSSHAHFDHLDRPTLAKLDKNIPIIAAHHTSDLVRDLGFRKIRELRWGESFNLRGLTVTARPVKHWGARTFYDTHRGFNAYLIESSQHRILFGGDTAFGDHFRDIGNVNLAILGIGAYNPYIAAHATPEQAWEMANEMRADFVLPMHHNTFRLSHEPMREPIERFMTAAQGQENRVAVHEIGGMWINQP
jgi:L-ascorbate metabolism protein UlaG (beta-lactamase superfamily)